MSKYNDILSDNDEEDCMCDEAECDCNEEDCMCDCDISDFDSGDDEKESNFILHAKREFDAMGWIDADNKMEEMQDLMCKQVLELLKLFSSHGHSGFSAPYAINMFKTLASFEPLGPLTGKDCEWNEVGDGWWQNNRCSHVFKGKDGRSYDSEGKIFREPNGNCYTSKDSNVYIEFPYTPKREYVDVEKE